MQRTSFAPVLSATLSRDSCWIIDFSWMSSWFSPPQRATSLAELALESGSAPDPGAYAGVSGRRSLGLLDDRDEAPTLGGGQRTGLHDLDPVADAALVVLVVRLQLDRATHDLAVQGVLHAVLDGHDDRLVHLVADDQALADLA